jgi:hypothetical protein
MKRMILLLSLVSILSGCGPSLTASPSPKITTKPRQTVKKVRPKPTELKPVQLEDWMH